MKVHKLFTISALFAQITQSATLSWADVSNAQDLGAAGFFDNGDQFDLDGTVDPAGTMQGGITDFSAGSGGSSPLMTASDGITQAQATFTTGGVNVADGDGSSSFFGLNSSLDTPLGTGVHGFILGGIGDPGALGFTAGGAPIIQGNTIHELGLSVDFSGHTGGGVTGVSFSLAGISAFQSVGLNLSSDLVRLRAFDSSGSQITIASSYLTLIGANSAYLTSGEGSTEVSFAGDLTNHVSNDHIATNTNVGVDFGAQEISRIEIDFAPTVTGTDGSISAGFAIGDISFNTVPEPSSALLSLLAAAGFCFRRRR